MQRRKPVTEACKATAVRQDWSGVLGRVFRRETRVLVEKSGIPVAAIVSTADLQLLQRLEEEERGAIERMRAAFQDVSEEELTANVSRVIEEVRAEERSRTRLQQA